MFSKHSKLLALMLVLVFCLTGCALGETGKSSQAAQELVFGVEEDGYTLEGDKANLGTYPLNVNIYETLVRLTPDYDVEPLLAESWEYKGDNTWRFYLRKGVKFHDGQEMNAEAVKFTLDRYARAGGSMINIGEDSVKIIDDYTIDITPTKVNMRLVEGLAHPQLGIIAPDSDPGRKPVGTGPFKFVSYQKDEYIIVERNPNYWGEPAKLEKITFKFIPDSAARVMALQAGEVDVIEKVPRESAGQLESTSGLKVMRSSPGSYSACYLSMNGKKPYDLLSSLSIRQALALSIDRESIVNEIWEGNAEVNQTVIPANVLGSERDRIQGFSYDPDKANKLLDEAGWKKGQDGIRKKNGRKLELTLVSGFPSAESHKPLPEIIKSQLLEVGIGINIVEVNDTGIYEEELKQGEGDIWLEAGSQNTADPTFLPELLFHSQGAYSLYYSAPFIPGAEFDSLIDEARSEPDRQKAIELAAEAMHVLIDEEVAVVPIAAIYNIFAMKDEVQGFEPHPSRINTNLAGIYIE
ncbi:MAG: ABC transporter substrate-binding protein [Clostridiaceae bacterium]|nr:ABC transporter substrate-binding protein [Clostridiaceae bacterium]